MFIAVQHKCLMKRHEGQGQAGKRFVEQSQSDTAEGPKLVNLPGFRIEPDLRDAPVCFVLEKVGSARS